MKTIESFKTGNEIKNYISGLDAALDIKNIASGLQMAAADVLDVVSPEVYKLFIAHAESEDFDVTDESDPKKIALNKLVHLLRVPVAGLGLFHHFIWFAIRVSNSGITTTKSNNETAAYKYQTDEAKRSLLQRAYAGISEVIDFLTENAEKHGSFTPDTAFAQNAAIEIDGQFYRAKENFTSGETFDVNDWTAIDKTSLFLHEWSFSDQKKESESYLFANYRDFDRYFGIDRSAAFFIKVRNIIKRNILKHIRPRFGSSVPADYLEAVKTYLAHLVVADAIIQLDVNLLPESIRGPINNEMNKKGGDVEFIRKNLRNQILEEAKEYIQGIDLNVASEKSSDNTAVGKFEVKADPTQKFYSSI